MDDYNELNNLELRFIILYFVVIRFLEKMGVFDKPPFRAHWIQAQRRFWRYPERVMFTINLFRYRLHIAFSIDIIEGKKI